MIQHVPTVRYGTIDTSFVEAMLARQDAEDGPVLMLNLMRYRDRADYPDDGGDAPDISGREADDRYAPLGVLAEIGAEVVLFGEVVAQSPDPSGGWHRVAVVRYPTFRSFLDMQERPDFQALHRHKEAGMERTIIAACTPEGPTCTTEVARPGGWLRVDLYAEPPAAAPAAGTARWRVEGCPVRDERTWSAVDVSATDSPDAPAADDGRVSVVFDALLDRLGRL